MNLTCIMFLCKATSVVLLWIVSVIPSPISHFLLRLSGCCFLPHFGSTLLCSWNEFFVAAHLMRSLMKTAFVERLVLLIHYLLVWSCRNSIASVFFVLILLKRHKQKNQHKRWLISCLYLFFCIHAKHIMLPCTCTFAASLALWRNYGLCCHTLFVLPHTCFLLPTPANCGLERLKVNWPIGICFWHPSGCMMPVQCDH